MTTRSCMFRLIGIISLALLNSVAVASTLLVQVVDASGLPLADAAIYAEPQSGQTMPKSRRSVAIEQKGRKFLPLVTIIQTGTEIAFPNNDTVRHHVYSFS